MNFLTISQQIENSLFKEQNSQKSSSPRFLTMFYYGFFQVIWDYFFYDIHLFLSSLSLFTGSLGKNSQNRKESNKRVVFRKETIRKG